MFIEGIGLSGYRSFGGQTQRIGPLDKLNLFIGQNNSGKSNLLLFLARHYGTAIESVRRTNNKWTFDPVLDRPLGDDSGQFSIEFGVKPEGEIYRAIMDKQSNLKRDSRAQEYVSRIFKSNTLTQGTRLAWFRYEGAWAGALSYPPRLIKEIQAEKVLTPQEWQTLWSGLTGASRGNIEQHWIPETLGKLTPIQFDLPKVSIVPAIRKVGDAGSSAVADYSGVGLIERLAELQNPGHHQQSLKEQFNQINEFLCSVTGNESAQLEIPYDRQTILVHMDGKTLPISHLGTGIHEVVILAAATTVLQNEMVCIEDPELHLHPLLQKKLVNYLQEKTDNQYFITTHSAHLFESSAAIFHVRNKDGRARFDIAVTPKDRSEICADLGYRASDLLQSNSVIWVEGPSDRIYINHWIRALDSSLIEGLHYSIMFYGGRLLSHLSANDPEVGDFISLRRLNRYITVVIDSDRSGPRSRINDTKKRVIEEFNKGPGFAWLTKGRQIENYVNPQVLEDAIKRVYPNAARLASTDPFSNCLSFKPRNGRVQNRLDKVKIAYEVANRPADLNVLDLSKMIRKIVQFVHEANDYTGQKALS